MAGSSPGAGSENEHPTIAEGPSEAAADVSPAGDSPPQKQAETATSPEAEAIAVEEDIDPEAKQKELDLVFAERRQIPPVRFGILFILTAGKDILSLA